MGSCGSARGCAAGDDGIGARIPLESDHRRLGRPGEVSRNENRHQEHAYSRLLRLVDPELPGSLASWPASLPLAGVRLAEVRHCGRDRRTENRRPVGNEVVRA